MRWKWILVPGILLFIGAALPAHSQVTYSAEEGKLPFTVGMGVSDIWLDWGVTHPKMIGITLWADWRLARVPAPIRGLGLEFEGRDVNWAAPASLRGHRMDTALAGPMYEWRSGRVRPFGKFLLGIGSIDYPSPGSLQAHDTLTVFAPAAGANVRAWKQISVRGEYEYQMWRHFLGPNDLTPHGFSIGAVYDFGQRVSE